MANSNLVKLLVDEPCLALLRGFGTDNIAAAFHRILESEDVELFKTSCLKEELDASVHLCLHDQKKRMTVYMECIMSLLGGFNSKNYTVATTTEFEHAYDHVGNLRVVVVRNNGVMVMRGPFAVQDYDNKSAIDKTRMRNRIKKVRAAAKRASV